MIESDQRKAVFLQEAFRVTQTHGKVHAARVEELKPWPSDVITARAFAPLNRLIEYAQPFMGKDYLCIFSKGCKAGDEIEEAKKRWVIDYEVHPGSEKEQGVILIIKRVSKHA